MNRNTSIFIKGFASIMILIYHICSDNVITSCGGYFGVGIFYFISGYNLAYCTVHKDDYTYKFLEKKFVRIFIPFYLAELLYQVVLNNGFKISLLYIFLKPDFDWAYAWYVKSIIYIYIMYFVICKIMQKYKVINYKVLGILVWLISGFLMIPFSKDPNHIFSLAFITGWFFVICDKKVKNIFEKNYISIVIIVVALVLAHYCSFYMYSSTFVYLCAQYMAPCLCGILSYIIAINFEVRKKVLLFTGMISYELYLIHPTIIRICGKYNFKMLIYATLVIFSSYIMAYILHFFMKQLDEKMKHVLKY